MSLCLIRSFVCSVFSGPRNSELVGTVGLCLRRCIADHKRLLGLDKMAADASATMVILGAMINCQWTRSSTKESCEVADSDVRQGYEGCYNVDVAAESCKNSSPQWTKVTKNALPSGYCTKNFLVLFPPTQIAPLGPAWGKPINWSKISGISEDGRMPDYILHKDKIICSIYANCSSWFVLGNTSG